MLNYKIQNKICPLPLSDIRFGGKIADQVEKFFYERVNSDFARNGIYRETLEQFTLRNDDDKPIGYWRGEFWGKWVISACRVARYENNAELTEFIRRAALELIATADPDGYIGTYKNPENVLPANPEDGIAVVGVPCDFNWNVWCRKYTLWGLLEAYMLTRDEKILEAADKFETQLFDMLNRLGVKITECGTFNGLPAGSTMKPLLILYRLTGKEKYLTYAIDIANDWEREDGKVPNIISNALAMKPVHEWYERPEKWAKAYEMMSCIDGLIELYRVTGVEKYLKTAENMYELLLKHEGNLLFSVGFNDQFAHGAAWPNSISEPCDVIHWIRMCYELYTLTGDVKYMNTVELAFYNPLLAGFFKDGKWGARGVRSVGRHMVAAGQASMKYSHCCVNNIPRGVLNVAESFVMQSADGLVINHYTDFSAKSDIADIEISGSYLADGAVTVKINAKRDFNLSLRIPAWSAGTALNGAEISAAEGYYTLAVKSGTSVLNLKFTAIPRLRELAEAPEHFPSQDFRVRRFVYDNIVTEDMMTWDARATLVYGPLLLTRSKLVGSTEKEMFDSETVAGKGFKCTVTPIECESVSYAFRASFENGAESVAFNMCDYASGTNLWSKDDMKLFNIFI
ncbi:MAG: glycoside hydrolase family 127 protein [Clostridia bacterium]|nr:glycoside hydrolase family 127 protein [Clostridia bacterium]